MIRIITSLSAEKRLERLTAELRENDCLIAPEQFLFETERNMYKLLGARKISGINITGFSKLSAGIVKKYGSAKSYADEIIKGVTMYKTVNRLKTSCAYYNSSSPGFAARMLDLAGELKAAGITQSALRKAAVAANLDSSRDGAGDEALSAKLADIAEIFSVYCDALEADYSDKLDDDARAASLIAEHGCFSGLRVFVYEFDGFSESQIAVLKAIAGSAEKLSILLRTDASKNGVPEFYAINALINRFKAEAANTGVGFERIDLGGRAYSPKTELWLADDAYAECEFIAAKIRELITENGYSCNEIAVLACRPDIMPKLASAFSDYGIQFFADLPEPIIKKPLARFILSALEAVSLDTDKVLAYIRSGFVRVPAKRGNPVAPRNLKLGQSQTDKRYGYVKTGGRLTKRLSKRDMDLLESAARRWNLTKKEWGSPFPEQNRELWAAEPLRKEIVSALVNLRDAARGVTGDKITEALCGFLIDVAELQRTVLGLCRSPGFNEADKKTFTDEYRQLWDLIVEVFESLRDALKGYSVSLDDYAELLRLFFSSVNIAKPPQVLDAVTAGDPERTRLNGAKVVFVAGANMGVFPKSAAFEGEFSSGELEALYENGLKIKAKRLERYYHGRFVADKALTLPSERLFITAPLRDGAWEELRPSPIFDDLTARGKAAGINRVSDLPLSFWARTVKTARKLFAENLGDRANAAVLKKALFAVGDGAFAEKLEAGVWSGEHFLTPETAERLFNFEAFSPTGLETLMSCRFKFFCRYGLGIRVPETRNDEEPAGTERGNIIHFCLDRLLRAYRETPEIFEGASDAKTDALAERCISDYRETKLPPGYAFTKRQEYILKSFKPGIIRMFRHIRDDFANSAFTPRSFEERVDFLFGGVRLTGKIDRTDVLVVDGECEYIGVTDYKTGGKEMDFPSVFYGLDTQILLYLFAACGDGVRKPSSALYMPADGFRFGAALEPENGSVSADASKTRGNWLSAHIPCGVYVADGSKAEKDFLNREQRYRAESGSLRKEFVKAKRLTPAAYENLKDYCAKLIGARVKQIKRGNIAAAPAVPDKNTAVCEYCDYSAVCGNGGKRVRLINKNAIERVIEG
ncbi:MAG: PD-(D/E)XK nuclease family protein [Oscillospiraceae bacterium]|jgi:ATP-dependent helicase/nuclease subunit B|nr:PD-(D/E)XK nuclease family protein [Oscillospiraceae bacterium]